MTHREPTPAEQRDFKKAAKILAKLGEAGVSLYLADDSLHLMAGPSHDDNGNPQQGNSRDCVFIAGAGGGAW